MKKNMGIVVYIFIAFIWTIAWIGLGSWLDIEWPFWVGMIGVAFIVVLTLLMIAHAWVINPIRDWKKRREYKKNK